MHPFTMQHHVAERDKHEASAWPILRAGFNLLHSGFDKNRDPDLCTLQASDRPTSSRLLELPSC